MTILLELSGGSALASFRLQRLLQKCQTRLPGLLALNVQYLYLVELADPLQASELERLSKLLAVDGRVGQSAQPDWVKLLVTPRIGTQSPWSSKATNIAQNCGFESVLRIERAHLYRCQLSQPLVATELAPLEVLLHDPMTESVFAGQDSAPQLFSDRQPHSSVRIPLLEQGRQALVAANELLGLAFSTLELDYLHAVFTALKRDPTDVELMTFAQVNSEHCRHKVFKASWQDEAGSIMEHSLFDMITHTYRSTQGRGVLSAYADNAAVLEGMATDLLLIDPVKKSYSYKAEKTPILIKVETHNHPTAIAPFPGAATGAGGEIRDESAVGRGSSTKAGLVGYCLSHLAIPGVSEPWESGYGYPEWLAPPLQIILEGPIGAAAFNNEFGRPNLLGYFRTFEQAVVRDGHQEMRGYHKPIMLAGGLGRVRPGHIKARRFLEGDSLIVLGGPAMLIGIGGGVASSQTSGSADAKRDFASVQRSNPEMQRRCQGVIDACCALGSDNPIRRIHDVGAGGLSNALSELVHDGGIGARIRLSAIPVADMQMSPTEVWCNESQERYVLAIAAAEVGRFAAICHRERCPFAVVGEAISDLSLTLQPDVDDLNIAVAGHSLATQTKAETTEPPSVQGIRETTVGPLENYLELSLNTLFGDWPKVVKTYLPKSLETISFDALKVNLEDAIDRVLRFPAVAAKMFLITIGDRSITGLVARDQLVGPWQVPVSDVAVTLQGYRTYQGEAMAVGERPPLALLNAAASARIAVAEALTNLIAADVGAIQNVALSANWMAATDHPGEAARLRDAVEAVGMELCPILGISIPVGKDSLSMQVKWQGEAGSQSVVSPVTLNVSAFAPVDDVRQTLTPQLQPEQDSALVFLDLAFGQQRLAGSVLAQVYGGLGDADSCPDVDKPTVLIALFDLLKSKRQHVLAYHDRSDGGLIATLAEMAFAGRCGFDLQIPLGPEVIPWLFNEEIGAVVQISSTALDAFLEEADQLELPALTIGQPRTDELLIIRQGEQVLLQAQRADWQQTWWSVSHHLQRLRDHPGCADAELAEIRADTPGLRAKLTFNVNEDVLAPLINIKKRPKVAILREQGVNGHVEMAAAFYAGRFQPVDVHMTDIVSGRVDLNDFVGMTICGGFSYGDVLGAGVGWARTIMFNSRLRDQFSAWFERQDRFTFGVCNGCQMLSELRELIPGSENWPHFLRNASEQFEARVALVEVATSTPSVMLAGMEGAVLPVAVAHGEGRAAFEPGLIVADEQVALRYVDHNHQVTERYPYNPNGSYGAIAGLTTTNGLVTAMMPHPERVFRTVQNSWHPKDWGEDGPWLRLFRNARRWVG